MFFLQKTLFTLQERQAELARQQPDDEEEEEEPEPEREEEPPTMSRRVLPAVPGGSFTDEPEPVPDHDEPYQEAGGGYQGNEDSTYQEAGGGMEPSEESSYQEAGGGTVEEATGDVYEEAGGGGDQLYEETAGGGTWINYSTFAYNLSSFALIEVIFPWKTFMGLVNPTYFQGGSVHLINFY